MSLKDVDKVKELEQLVRQEIIQKKEEGYDITDIENEFLKIKKKSLSKLEYLLRVSEKRSMRPDFHYREPSDLREIEAERPKEPKEVEVTLSESELYNKIYGGWLGRCAGCLLGKPVEGFGKEQIEEWLKIAGEYPLRDYFPEISVSSEKGLGWLIERLGLLEKIRKGGYWGRINVFRGKIDRMARDDDIDYTVLGLQILETYGPNFTTTDVGETWLYLLPFWQVYTAERVAYRNLVKGILPPETATYMNPYREWIGAQIRADIWGYVTPGMPEIGAELAHRDAVLSHVKNGIYGEMFVSAMISAAFASNNTEEIIEAGLSVIPKNCRLTEAINDVVAWSKEYNRWEETWDMVMKKYGNYHPVHTINNAAIVLLGLIYGEGDYEKSITISVMGGLDTDCNGATTGSILGVMLGSDALPDKWIKPLNDRLESFVIGYNDSRISSLAKRTLRLTKSFRKG